MIAAMEPLLNGAKTVLGIGGLIFVHELGHFMVGRWCGVRAEAFSIGFGPSLLKWQQTPTSTEYRLCALPLGGYVKFLADQPGEDGALEPDSFQAATYPRKSAIMLAGVAMNVVIAFLLFIGAFTNGVEAFAPVAGTVSEGMPAWAAGIEPGDRFVRINGDEPRDFMDVVYEVKISEELEIELERNGERLPPMHLRTGVEKNGIGAIGVSAPFLRDGTMMVFPNTPAAEAGFQDGDRVTAVGEDPVASFEEAVESHEQRAAATQWTIVRDGAEIQLTMPFEGTDGYRIGVLLDAPVIASVRRAGPAYAAGLRDADIPVSVGDTPTPTYRSVRRAVLDGDGGSTLLVERAGTPITVPLPDDAEGRAAFADSFSSAGTDPDGIVYVTPLDEEGKPSAARDAGLPAGARVLRMNGESIAEFTELHEVVQNAGKSGSAIELEYRAPGSDAPAKLKITPEKYVRWDGAGAQNMPNRILLETDSIVEASVLGIGQTHREVMRILSVLGSMVSGNVSPTNLSGPIAIAKHSYRSAEQGLSEFFLFLGMISLNLAVLNLLPIPVLDGGQLMMITAEKVRGQPLPENVQAGIQWAGLIMIVGLMVFVIGNDLIQL